MPSPDVPIHPNQTPRLGSRLGVRVREDTAYTDPKGQEKDDIRKNVDKALDQLQEPLSKVLEPEEAVLYLTYAQAPASLLEQLAFGWYAYAATATWLVFTNRRLLQFRVRFKGFLGRHWNWTRSLRSVRWGDVQEAKAKGWLSPKLQLRYRNGKKETYWGLRGPKTRGLAWGAAKKLKTLLGALLPASTAEGTPAQTAVSLCPDCQAVLTPGVYQCSQCGLAFKDEKTLVRRSLLIPGGGYFYAGHWWLGVGDFVVEAYLLIVAVIMVGVALGGADPMLEPGEAATEPAVAWFVVGFLAVILAAEKWFTVHHCRRFIREFIPLKK